MDKTKKGRAVIPYLWAAALSAGGYSGYHGADKFLTVSSSGEPRTRSKFN